MTSNSIAMQVIQALKALGVKHIFGVPSGGWVDYMEAIRQTEGIEFVLTSHEGGAAFMADVSARITGVVGVCFGTFGPGATNLATGVGSAFLDRTPMLVLTDVMPENKRYRRVQMNIDHHALFAPITKHSTQLTPNNVKATIFAAASRALSEIKGPVHIGLPLGLSNQISKPENTPILSVTLADKAKPEAIEQMSQLFKQASKPVIVLGLRAKDADIQQPLLRFIEQQQIPVIITPMAKGMINESHPCYAGVLFHALSDSVALTHQQADLVISIGYDEVEFNYEQWIPDAPLISLDIIDTDIEQPQLQVVCDVIGDIKHSFMQLCSLASSGNKWDMADVVERKQRMFATMTKSASEFGPCNALDSLRKFLPENGIMTSDVGAHLHLLGQKWPTPAPGLQIMTNGWSSMGFAIPAAIAAKLSRPNIPVCAVIGDGGFLMTAGELAVAVRENLAIVFVLFTDNDLALIRIKQQRKNNPIYGTPIRSKGTIGGDNIFGVPVLKAYNVGEFEHALENAFAANGPIIVEAIMSSAQYDKLLLRKDKP